MRLEYTIRMRFGTHVDSPEIPKLVNAYNQLLVRRMCGLGMTTDQAGSLKCQRLLCGGDVNSAD
jgi:hypothetical protein